MKHLLRLSAQGRFVRQSGGKVNTVMYGSIYHKEGKIRIWMPSLVVFVPREFIPAEQGLKEAMQNGVLAGYPLVDMHTKLMMVVTTKSTH